MQDSFSTIIFEWEEFSNRFDNKTEKGDIKRKRDYTIMSHLILMTCGQLTMNPIHSSDYTMPLNKIVMLFWYWLIDWMIHWFIRTYMTTYSYDTICKERQRKSSGVIFTSCSWGLALSSFASPVAHATIVGLCSGCFKVYLSVSPPSVCHHCGCSWVISRYHTPPPLLFSPLPFHFLLFFPLVSFLPVLF